MVSCLKLSPAASKTIAAAFRSARSKNIGAGHLFLGLMAVDPGLIANFKIKGINRFELIAHIRSLANKKCSPDQGMVVDILRLSSRIARSIPVNNQHMLLAMILEPSSPVSSYLAKCNIDVLDLARKKFYLTPITPGICGHQSVTSKQENIFYSENRCDLLTGLFTKLISSQAIPTPRRQFFRSEIPRVTPSRPSANSVRSEIATSRPEPPHTRESLEPAHRISPSPEQRAKKWLGELIPEQAQLYAFSRYIEIESKLYAGRYYRIFSNALTEIYERGKRTATCCIHLRDLSIPRTDRVIGEYFMIKGDENTYLRIANVTRVS